MAQVICKATGDLTSSGTWAAGDSTAVVTDGATSATNLTTTAQASSNFAPGAVTVDAIALKLMSRGAGVSTASVTIELYDATSSSSVVSIAVPEADLPVCSNAVRGRGGWLLFSLGGSYLLEAGKNYQVRLSHTANTIIVSFFTSATGTNWQHILRTTTAAAPAAGDNMFILGLWTASNTWTNYTVTQNQTTTGTVYGSAMTGTEEERTGIAINRSTLTWPTGASSAIAIAGKINIGPYGICNIGTTASPIARGFTAIVQFNTTTVNGIQQVGVGSEFTMVGVSPTDTKNRNWTYLTSDATSGSTASVTVAHDTGWTSGSTVYISTSRIANGADAALYTLAADAGTNSLTFTAAYSATHKGEASDWPFPAHVMLCGGYNIIIQSDAINRGALVTVEQAGAMLAPSYTHIEWVGGQYCRLDYAAVTWDNTLRYCGLYDLTNTPSSLSHFGISGACAGTWDWHDLCGESAVTAAVFDIGPSNTSTFSGMSFENLVFIADNNTNPSGFRIPFAPVAVLRNLFGFGAGANLNIESVTGFTDVPSDYCSGSILFGLSGTAAISFATGIAPARKTFTNIKVCSSTGSFTFGNGGAIQDSTFSQCVFLTDFGFMDLSFPANVTNLVLDRCVIGGFAGLSQSMTQLFNFGSGFNGWAVSAKFLGCEFSNSYCTPPVDALVKLGQSGGLARPNDIRFVFSPMNGTPTVGVSGSGSYVSKDSFVSVFKWGGTSGDHRVWRPWTVNGETGGFTEVPVIQTDSTIYRTAAPSERVRPKSTTSKFESSVKRFAVTSGSTASVGVWAYRDGTYDGNPARLVIKKHDVAGYAVDTVGATMSTGTGAWENLTTTIAAVPDDVVLEVVVDCDGTTGSIYVDDWSAT